LSPAERDEAVNRGEQKHREQHDRGRLQHEHLLRLLHPLLDGLLAGFLQQVIAFQHLELAHDLPHIAPTGRGIQIKGTLDDVTAAFLPLRLGGAGPDDFRLGTHRGEQGGTVDRIRMSAGRLLLCNGELFLPGCRGPRQGAGEQPVGDHPKGIHIP